MVETIVGESCLGQRFGICEENIHPKVPYKECFGLVAIKFRQGLALQEQYSVTPLTVRDCSTCFAHVDVSMALLCAPCNRLAMF